MSVGVLVGCAGPDAAPPPEGTIAAPPHTPDSTGDGARVTDAYERFWDVTHSLPHLPGEQRSAELTAVAVERLAATMLQNLTTQQDQGLTPYGETHARISAVQVDGDRAVVTDCQDASRSGQADASGQPRTVGLDRKSVV